MAKKPNMTKYMAETYRDLTKVLNSTQEAIDLACDDAHRIVPACSGREFDLLLENRDRLVVMVNEVASLLDEEATNLIHSLDAEEAAQ